MLVLAALALSPGCGEDKRQAAPPPREAVPVTVAAAQAKAVPDLVEAVGTVEPSATVGVKAQVGGILQEVGFREGQEVRAGDLLFRLDPRPFEAALRQAQANLARDMAQLENARKELARAADLAGKGMVAQSQHDSAKAAAAALEAATQADEAAVESARLQLSYTVITAPIGGRTGSLGADPGNLVKAGSDSPLVVINRIDPAFVSFAVPEKDLPRVLAARAAGPVRVTASPEGQPAREGALSFIENQVDRASGTIRLRATFANHGPGGGAALWPGQFVPVRVTLSVDPNGIVIPAAAVQMGQKGSFVFVVKDDRSVEVRPVRLVRLLDTEAVVESGLAAGEVVVTDGILRLTAGSKVAPRGTGGAAPSAR